MRDMVCSFALSISKRDMTELASSNEKLEKLVYLIYSCYLELEVTDEFISDAAKAFKIIWDERGDYIRRNKNGYAMTVYSSEKGMVAAASIGGLGCYNYDIRTGSHWVERFGPEEEFEYPDDFYDVVDNLVYSE